MHGTAPKTLVHSELGEFHFAHGTVRPAPPPAVGRTVTLGEAWDGVPAGVPIHLPSPADVACALRRVPTGAVHGHAFLMALLRSDADAEPSARIVAACLARIASDVWEGLVVGRNLLELPPIWRVVAPGTALARRCGLPDPWLAVMRSRELERA